MQRASFVRSVTSPASATSSALGGGIVWQSSDERTSSAAEDRAPPDIRMPRRIDDRLLADDPATRRGRRPRHGRHVRRPRRRRQAVRGEVVLVHEAARAVDERRHRNAARQRVLNEREQLEVQRRRRVGRVGGQLEVEVHVQPLRHEARQHRNRPRDPGPGARPGCAGGRRDRPARAVADRGQRGVGRRVPERVAQVLGQAARTRGVAGERRRCGTWHRGAAAPTSPSRASRSRRSGRPSRGCRASSTTSPARSPRRGGETDVRTASGSWSRCRCSPLAAAHAGSRPGTISAARSSLASRNGCTGSLANATFEVNGPTRPSSGMPDTSASTPNASLIVARYSARVRRAKPDCRTPGTGTAPPAPVELPPRRRYPCPSPCPRAGPDRRGLDRALRRRWSRCRPRAAALRRTPPPGGRARSNAGEPGARAWAGTRYEPRALRSGPAGFRNAFSILRLV